MAKRFRHHSWPGKLIVVEGLDGSGKSTQLALLREWLSGQDCKVHLSEWNSSPLIRPGTKLGKREKLLSPTTFSLIHCADFSDRFYQQIEPLLQTGYLVLCDRYIFTAFARDGARGCAFEWLKNLYSFAPLPDVTFYFDTPLDVAMSRVLSRGKRPKYYEAGMDLQLSSDRSESFRLFQAKVQKGYEELSSDFHFYRIDSTLPPIDQQKEMRRVVNSLGDLNTFLPKGG